jgi:hypothetical protein
LRASGEQQRRHSGFALYTEECVERGECVLTTPSTRARLVAASRRKLKPIESRSSCPHCEQRKRSARIASSSIAGNARDIERASVRARTGTRKQLYHPSFNFLSAYRVYTDMGYGAKRIRRVHDDACRSPIFVFENFVDSDTRSARDSPALRRVSRSFLSLRVPPGDDAPRFSPTVCAEGDDARLA